MNNIDYLFEQVENSGCIPDVNDVIVIDPVTRTMHIPNTEGVLGVEFDVDAERKYFVCPTVVGNDIHISDCTVYVNYLNANNDKGSYIVSDVSIDGDNALFSWELSDRVTKYKGQVKFMVCLCVIVDGVVKNDWHTTLVTANVLEGLDVEDVEPDFDDTAAAEKKYYIDATGTAWFAEDVFVDNGEVSVKGLAKKLQDIPSLENVVKAVLEALPTWEGGSY